MPHINSKAIRSLCSRLLHGAQDAAIKIQPDLDYVILSGDQNEAAGQYLRGKVILRAPLSQHITGIRLSLVGYHRLSSHYSPLPSPGTTRQTTILEKELPPLMLCPATRSNCRSTKHIAVYEWPFEILVPGKTPESTRGCYRCSIAYYLTARSIRPGSKTYPQSFRAIRIIRTPSLSAFELMDPLSVEGCSSNKFSYSASIFHQAVALGTRIPAELGIKPSSPGLRLLSASCQLMEIHSIENRHVPGNTNFSTSHEICRWDLLNAAIEGLGTNGLCIKQELPLPDVAAKCSPDADAHGIRVCHAINFDILADMHGEEIKVRASLPIVLFVSPHLPINGLGHFVKGRVSMEPDLWDGVQIPPRYSEHEADELLETCI